MSSNNLFFERKRRKRTLITVDQLDKLEQAFSKAQWPNRSYKQRLANEIHMSEQFISIWFQNKRARIKREEEFAKLAIMKKAKLKAREAQMRKKGLDLRFALTENADQRRESPSQIKTQFQVTDKQYQSKPKTPQRIVIAPKGIFLKSDTSGDSHRVEMIPFHQQVQISEGIRTYVNTINTPSRRTHPVLPVTGTPRVNQLPVSSPASDEPDDERNETALALAAVRDQPSRNSSPPSTLFQAILSMVALREGGIVSRENEQFPQAVSDSLYGININGTHRLVYEKESGLQLVPFRPLFCK